MWYNEHIYCMDKTKTRIILILVAVIILGGSYFGVLATEEKKRLSSRNVAREDLATTIMEMERVRREYFSAIEERRAELRQSMDSAKEQYETLLKEQPALIDANKKGVTVPVKKTVTVKVPTTTVTKSKPQSTRKTKSS